jgi:putative RNA 2'-phosphotransferase
MNWQRARQDRYVKSLYHGTTPSVASKILREGLKPMKRRQVHLSPTVEVAEEVRMRRTKNPVVLEIGAETAIRDGMRFYRATAKVYVCGTVSPKYVKIVGRQKRSVEYRETSRSARSGKNS